MRTEPRPVILRVEDLHKAFRGRVARTVRAAPEVATGRERWVGGLMRRPRLLGPPPVRVPALEGVSLEVPRGGVVGLVGESGSGKSTLARCLMGLTEPDSGSMQFEGRDVGTWVAETPLRYRSMVQMVFQHPDLALDPRYTVSRAIGEVLAIHGIGDRADRMDRIAHLLERVHLDPAQVMHRLPRQLSGGQRQRVVIARAIAVQPRFLVLDEPTSALDASVQSRVLDLLVELRETDGMSYLFISHDLGVVRFVSQRVVVLYRGRVVEAGPTEQIFTDPKHPYTRALLASAPVPDPHHRYDDGYSLRGELQHNEIAGDSCVLCGRCPIEQEVCSTARPQPSEVGAGHVAACHRSAELAPYAAVAQAGGPR